MFVFSSCGEKSPEEIERANKRKIEQAVRRAHVMTAENNLKGAIDVLENAHRHCGSSVLLCETLANTFAQDNQTALAGMFYEQAYDADNTRSDLLIFAANAYEQTNSIDAAISAYEKFLEKNPTNNSVKKNLAMLYEKQNNFNKALNTYMSAIKVENRDPNTAEAAVIGGLFAKLGNIPQAKLWLETALKVTLPTNVSTRKEICSNLIPVYLERKEWNNLENVIAILDSIQPDFVNKNYPTLKAQLAEFKHKLAEVKAVIEANETLKEIEEASKKREAENEKARQEIEAQKKAEEEKRKAEELAKEQQKKQEEQIQKNLEVKKAENNKDNIQQDVLTDAIPQEDIVKNELKQNKAKIEKKPEVKQESDLQEYIRKAKEYISIKDKQNALVFANKAITESTISPDAWEVMADAFELNNLLSDAYLAANEAYLINTDSTHLAIKLLRLAQKNKDNNSFLNRAKVIFDKFNDNPVICFYLAKAYEANSDTPNAKKYFAKVLELDKSENTITKEAKKFVNKK